MSSARDEKLMDIGGHLDELRARIIRCVVVLLIFAIVAFIFKDYLSAILFAPSHASFVTFTLLRDATQIVGFSMPTELTPEPIAFINTQMAGQFNLHLSISFWAAIIATVPFILLQMWLFIKPALSQEMIGKFGGGVAFVSLLFFVGVAFGYFVIAPLAINFLTNYSFDEQITNMIATNSYISTVMNISLAGGIAFQLPFLVRVLAGVGVLSADDMRKYRRVAIAAIVIASAILTPPDLFSQVLLIIPLLALYEMSIIIAKRSHPEEM